MAFLLISGDYISALFYNHAELKNHFVENQNIIFAIIEYIVFYYFFRAIIISRVIKALMFFFLFPLVIAGIFFFYKIFSGNISQSLVRKSADLIISVELLLLAFFCIVYYYELFRKKPVYNLNESPSFWIVTGLFLYSITIIPFFMITNIFIPTQKSIIHIFYSFHYISFGFLFLAITKAFLCRKPLTT